MSCNKSTLAHNRIVLITTPAASTFNYLLSTLCLYHCLCNFDLRFLILQSGEFVKLLKRSLITILGIAAVVVGIHPRLVLPAVIILLAIFTGVFWAGSGRAKLNTAAFYISVVTLSLIGLVFVGLLV